MALSLKHQEFVNQYIACYFNATEAYRRVYPKSSDDAARAHGARLVADGNVAEEIKQRIAENAMSADEVLMRLGEQARAEQSQYLTAQGVDLEALIRNGKGHLVKGIKETKYGRDIEFYDAQAALVHIGKHHKLFTDMSETKITGTMDITADERAQAQKETEEWKQKKAAETSNG